MRHFILIGGLAAGVLVYLYEYWLKERVNQHSESPHGGPRGGPGGSDDDYVVINSTAPKKIKSGPPKLPSKDDKCVICMDLLIRISGDRGYAIIALPHCGHWFHQKCALRLLEYHPFCPMCRLPIDNDALRGTPVRFTESSAGGDNETDSQPSSASHFNSDKEKLKKTN